MKTETNASFKKINNNKTDTTQDYQQVVGGYFGASDILNVRSSLDREKYLSSKEAFLGTIPQMDLWEQVMFLWNDDAGSGKQMKASCSVCSVDNLQ